MSTRIDLLNPDRRKKKWEAEQGLDSEEQTGCRPIEEFISGKYHDCLVEVINHEDHSSEVSELRCRYSISTLKGKDCQPSTSPITLSIRNSVILVSVDRGLKA